MRIATALLTAILALVCAAAQAQAFRWVDKDGKIRYGDSPPPGVKATLLKGISAGGATTPPEPAAKDPKGAAKAPANPAQTASERQLKAKEEAANAEQERVEAQMRQKNCGRAQSYLRTLESGQRVSTTNAQGERAFLEDSQRQTQAEEMKAEIAKNCK